MKDHDSMTTAPSALETSLRDHFRRLPHAVIANPMRLAADDYPAALDGCLSAKGFAQAVAQISEWPGYEPTPLLSLDDLARDLGVGAILYKDESLRFGLKSFKALGGAYAVLAVLKEKIAAMTGETDLSFARLTSGEFRSILDNVVVTCATAGNHGRSVAWGARLFGCRCVIFVSSAVSEGRAAAIAAHGAEIRRVDGNYDDSVHAAAAVARERGWTVISDTSYEGYTDIPTLVMQGYGVMLAEICAALPDHERPTHVFVQGGVGGLAAACCAYFWQHWAGTRPRFIVVEPMVADCLFRSAEAREPVAIRGDLETVMGCLACGEVSLTAWSVLRAGVDHFMTIPDDIVAPLMIHMARRRPRIIAGESAVAGLAAAGVAATRPSLRAEFGITAESRILCIGTEGDTAPDMYRQLTGMDPASL